MAGGGFDSPVYDPNDPSLDDSDGDNDDGDQDPNETIHFWPGSESTPGPSGEEIPIQTMEHEKSGLPDTSNVETPSLEGSTHQDDKEAMLERAKTFIKNLFPKADLAKLGPVGFGKKSGNVGKVVLLGSRGGETKIFRDNGSGLLKSFTYKFRKSLGPEAESVIAQDNDKIRETRQSLREAESQLKETEKLSSESEKALQEVKDLRTKLDQTQARIDALHDEQGSTVESESELRRLRQRRKISKQILTMQKSSSKTSKKHSERTRNS